MLHRRDFLNSMGAALLGGLRPTLAFGERAEATISNKKRIVIIGAGLSGLAAARELHKRGHDVVIVEARERIGGRIWTSTKWSGIPLDFGASWIHGVRGNPITALADEIRADRRVTSFERVATYASSGKPLSRSEQSRMEGLRKQVYRAIKTAQDRAGDVSIRQAVEPLLQKFPKSSEAIRYIHFILNSEMEQEYAGSAERLSAQWYNSAKTFGGDDVLFAQGFKVIPEFLAKNLPIELGQVVQEVHWDSSPVRVVTHKTTYLADCMVVTLPLGVLQAQRVRFTPALPPEKRRAIASLGMGVLNKCYLRFPKVFWSSTADWLEYVPARWGEWAEWVSFKRATNMPILLGFNAADQGRAIEAWTDARIVASAVQTLRAIYGAGIPEPVDYQITRWASDPFAFGSYSYNAVGSHPSMRTALATPLKHKVFFAGEATESDYFGTAHGAYLSGIRAAKQILTSLA